MRFGSAAITVLALILVGCGTTRTEITTETSRTERIKDVQIVDPGSPESAGESSSQGEVEIETETETEERVIEEGPIVR